MHGIRTVSLRLTNTYGPRMDLASGRKGFVGVFLKRALAGRKIQIFGDGKQRRDFNYIDDVCEALLLAGEHAELHGGVYNLGHPRAYSLLEFAETLRRHCSFPYELVPFPAEAAIIDIGDYYGDFTRFHAATAWQPRIDLDEGLRRTVDYFRHRQQQGPEPR